jgi:secreted trypsin-like serine protease
MRCAPALAFGLAVAASCCESAHAISTLEDVLRNAPRIFRTPSGMPPNNAIHRGPAGRRAPADSGDTDRDVPDEGPGADQPLVQIPAESVPWLVAIGETEDLRQDFLCAGVLIDPNWVLTAAHCLFLVGRSWPHDSRPLIFVGSRALSSPGRSFPIEEIVTHPGYSPITLKNDVALVKFDPGEYPVAPMAVEGPSARDHVGDIGTILGFGATTSGVGQPRRGALKLIQAAIADDGVCFSATQYASLSNTGVFCARALLKRHDICRQFSGSPLVLYDRGGRLHLLGLVTWNTVCPLPEGRLNVFQDIRSKVPWIKSVIGTRPGSRL